MSIEEWIGVDQEPAGALSDEGCKSRFEVFFAGDIEHQQFPPERGGSRLNLLLVFAVGWITWSRQKSDHGIFRYQLRGHFEPLG